MATPINRLFIDEQFTQRVRVEQSTPRPEGDVDQPAKKAFTVSPTASVNASIISTAAPCETAGAGASREWSASSSVGMPSPPDFRPSIDTPLPERPSRLSSVVNFFKRSSSTHRYRSSSQHQDDRLNQRVRETKEAVRGHVEELENLKRQLAANEAELEMRRRTIESLEGTQQHAQELLKRNSELEMLIASVQDEADAMLLKERELRRKAHEEVKNANQRADTYNSRILSLETELRDAQQSSRVTDDILQLRRSVAEKESLIVKLRSELSGADVELKELKGIIERERMALEKLSKERQAHMNNIAGVSVELKGLLEQNNDLEEELRMSAERHERLIDDMKLKLKEANSEGQARAQGAARLQAELQVAEANWRRAEENLDALRKQNDELRLRINDVERTKAEIEHLKVSLAESEERRQIEKDHADESLKRLKEQISSLQGIHKRAESLLQRNSELERLLASFTDKLSAAVGDDAPVVRRLRADLQATTSELRNAEQRVKTQENDLKLLEGTLRDTKRRLQAAESEVERRRRVEGSSLQTGGGESFQVALEKALTANTDSTRREIARLQKEYDALIRNIREAHSRELKAQEEGLQERIRAAEAAKDTEFANVLRQKEREWSELQMAQDRALQEAQRNHTQLQSTLERMREAMKAQDEEVRSRVESVRREAEQETAERIADLKRSLEGLVAHATSDLQKEVESLKSALAQAQRDRDAAVDEQLKLGRSVNQLQAAIEEKEAALAQMTRQYQEYEKSTTRQVEELRNMIRSQKGPATEDHDDLRRMLKRNEELEAMIADMSEKFHNELRIHMEEVAKTRRQKLDMEARVNGMARELAALQSRSQNPTGLSEVEKADLDRRIIDLTAQLARSEAQKKALSDELENERKRLQVLQKRPHRMSEGRRDWKAGLMERLSELQTLAQTYRQTPAASVSDLESARAAAEQKRLAAEIDHLKSQVTERQEKIELLEGNLQSFRTARPIQDGEKEQLRAQLQSLRGERQTLADECSILEESLRKQRQTLAAEITRRDKQLSDLTRTNDELGRALKRNAELESQLNKMFEDLRHKLSSAPAGGHDGAYTSVFETLSAFETEFRSRTFQYDMDMKQLVASLDEREGEVFRLQQELVDLRQDLQRNHQQHIDSQRLQFEAERDALLSENRGLRDMQNKLQGELDRLRQELAEAQAVDSERVTRMVTELNNKISEHQLLVAELADEKDNEVRRIEAKLKLSMAAQDRLRVEIDKVTSELGNKEADIADLSATIKRIMSENGITPEGLEDGLGSGNEEWATMIGTIETMFSRLSRSRKDANSLCSTLNALLQEQQRSLREIAESQNAAAKLRDQMSDSLNTANDEPLGRTVIRTSFGVRGGRISGLNNTLADIDKEMETVRQAHMDLLAAQTPGKSGRLTTRLSVLSQSSSRQVTRTSTVGEEGSPSWRHGVVSDTSNKRKMDSSRMSESKRAKLSTD